MRTLTRIGWFGSFVLLFACHRSGGSDAIHYRDALAAPSWEEAKAECLAVSIGDNRGDCLVGAMEAFDRLEREDCDALPDGTWRDECIFLLAERAQRSGDLPAAFAACEETRFARECSYHLIRAGAHAVVDATVAEVNAAAEPYRTLPRAPDATALFWKAWIRERSARGESLDLSLCPDDLCRAAVREVLFQRLNGLFLAAPGEWCVVNDGVLPPPPTAGTGGPAWAVTPEMIAMATEWLKGNCARWRDGQAAGAARRPGRHDSAAPP